MALEAFKMACTSQSKLIAISSNPKTIMLLLIVGSNGYPEVSMKTERIDCRCAYTQPSAPLGKTYIDHYTSLSLHLPFDGLTRTSNIHAQHNLGGTETEIHDECLM